MYGLQPYEGKSLGWALVNRSLRSTSFTVSSLEAHGCILWLLRKPFCRGLYDVTTSSAPISPISDSFKFTENITRRGRIDVSACDLNIWERKGLQLNTWNLVMRGEDCDDCAKFVLLWHNQVINSVHSWQTGPGFSKSTPWAWIYSTCFWNRWYIMMLTNRWHNSNHA